MKNKTHNEIKQYEIVRINRNCLTLGVRETQQFGSAGQNERAIVSEEQGRTREQQRRGAGEVEIDRWMEV